MHLSRCFFFTIKLKKQKKLFHRYIHRAIQKKTMDIKNKTVKHSELITELKKLTPENKNKVAKEFKEVILAPITNIEKLEKIKMITIRVTEEQAKEYKQLSKITKVPLSTMVRKSLNTIVKKQMLVKKLTPNDKQKQLKAFQRRMGLID